MVKNFGLKISSNNYHLVVQSLNFVSLVTAYKSNFINSKGGMNAVNDFITITRDFDEMIEIVFELNDFKRATALLRNSKALDNLGLSNFQLKYAHPTACPFLKILFNKSYLI